MAAALPAAESKNTVKYLEIHGKDLVGKQVTLDVTHVAPVKALNEEAKDYGIQVFQVHTLNKKSQTPGGTIMTFVEADESERFLKRYGYTPEVTKGRDRVTDSRTYRAVLQKNPKGDFCLFDSEEAGKGAIDFMVALDGKRQKKEEDEKAALGEKVREEMRKNMRERMQRGKGGPGVAGPRGKPGPQGGKGPQKGPQSKGGDDR